MRLIVDRVEESIVICENETKEMVEINVSEFCTLPKTGDIVEMNDEGKYEILVEETEIRKENIAKRFSKLFKK